MGSKPCSIREKYKRVVRLGGFEISEELVVFFTNLFVNVHNRVLKFEPQLVALNWAIEARIRTYFPQPGATRRSHFSLLR